MSSIQKKNVVRSNRSQIKYLCQYMAQHRHFASGNFKTPHGAESMEREWCRLKEALDELGPNRSVEQWKVCWRDQKRKAREEGAATSRAVNATGNSVPVPELSENSALILGTIGEQMAVGIGPDESPIGFVVEDAEPQAIPTRPTPPEAISTPPPCVAGPSHVSPVPPSAPNRPRRTRVRKTHPPDRFLKVQEQNNYILKEILQEMRHSNELRKQQNMLLWRITRKK